MQKRLLAIITISVSLVSCSSSSVPPSTNPTTNSQAKLAQVLLDIERTVGSAQTSLIALNKDSQISDEDTRIALAVCSKINIFSSQASSALKTATPNSSILVILGPITMSLSDDITNSVINIKNPTAKASVQLILVGIQTSLSILQLTLKG